MRITAGQHRGRKLQAPDIDGLRPTPSRVREALFNILGPIHEKSWLDLFAGSGIMSLEALSRGAASATAIEQHIKAVRAMQSLHQTLHMDDDWQIRQGLLPQALQPLHGQQFDLVFADPPYNKGIAEQIPGWLDAHAIRCHRLVIEESSAAKPHWPANWTCTSSRRYGDTCLHFLIPEEHEHGEKT